MEVNIYIGFWTLKMKCTQYGLYEQATSKTARAIFLFKVGQSRLHQGSEGGMPGTGLNPGQV